MIPLPQQVSSVAQVIQLAIAPVFLLAGVGALLGVLANRLARVIDRFHVLERSLAGVYRGCGGRRGEGRVGGRRRQREVRRGIAGERWVFLLACAAGSGGDRGGQQAGTKTRSGHGIFLCGQRG